MTSSLEDKQVQIWLAEFTKLMQEAISAQSIPVKDLQHKSNKKQPVRINYVDPNKLQRLHD